MSALKDTDIVFLGLSGVDVKQAVTDLEHLIKGDEELASTNSVEPLRRSSGLQSILDTLYHALHNGVEEVTDKMIEDMENEEGLF